MGIFEHYRSEASFDEMLDGDKRCRSHWESICAYVEKAGVEGLRAKQAEIDWSLEENGVTYNVYDHPEGDSKRRWALDPIPFIIDEKEWKGIARGVEQRAKLFSLILKDLYGEQRLIRENILPAEVVFAHKGYSAEVFDFGLKEHFDLYFYATDMARGPDGKMWIVNDRIQAPSGLGYAIENRLSMNIVSKTLYPGVKTRKLARFVEEMKEMIQHLGGDETSQAALLTPGPHNETFFEHAYLSSLLEIPMVQGDDLLVKNGALWLKNLGGLMRIHTLLRRVDDRFCDPLELRSDSRLGVPGLVEAMRRDHLKMVNPIGSSILENVGLNPFMSAICKFFLGEELILPQIATWWCGHEKERNYVLDNLDKLIIKKIDRTGENETYLGRKLKKAEKEELRRKLAAQPFLYAAQEEIAFSTAPYFTGERIEPRNAVIRSYALRKGDGYSVMNGGLVRVSTLKDSLLVSSQKGGTSKDLWIVGEKDDATPANPFKQLPCIDAAIDDIPTLRAENLFWLGRYLGRAIVSTRLIRYTIKRMINIYRDDSASSETTRELLLKSLTHLTMTYPGFLTEEGAAKLMQQPMPELLSILKDRSRPGSLAFTLSTLSNTNVNIKNMLAIEAWKLFDRLQNDWDGFRKSNTRHLRVIVNEMDRLHIHLMAYKALVEESMFKEEGLILYEIGFEIESALLLISKARALLCLKLDKATEYEIVEALLNSCESFNAYRAHYKSSLQLENVVELLLLNPQFPKSLTYRARQLLNEFKTLPKSRKHLSSYEEPVFRAYSMLRLADVKTLLQDGDEGSVYGGLDRLLSDLSTLFVEASNELTKTYFSHYDE